MKELTIDGITKDCERILKENWSPFKEEPHIAIKASDTAQVWYLPEMDQIIIRHVIMEGEFACFVQNEFDEEFTPSWVCQGWHFIGAL